jgi:hypothetical protein
VVGSANHFERLSILESHDMYWDRRVRLVGRQDHTELRKSVGTPGVELVIFGEHDAMLESAFDSLDSFGQSAFTAGDGDGLE